MRELSAATSPKLVLAALGISIAVHLFAISVIPHPGRLPFKRPIRVEVELTTRTLPLPEEVPVPLPPPAEIEEPATPEPIAKTASPPSQPHLQTAPALPKKSTEAPRLAKSRKPNEVALPVPAAKKGRQTRATRYRSPRPHTLAMNCPSAPGRERTVWHGALGSCGDVVGRLRHRGRCRRRRGAARLCSPAP